MCHPLLACLFLKQFVHPKCRPLTPSQSGATSLLLPCLLHIRLTPDLSSKHTQVLGYPISHLSGHFCISNYLPSSPHGKLSATQSCGPSRPGTLLLTNSVNSLLLTATPCPHYPDPPDFSLMQPLPGVCAGAQLGYKLLENRKHTSR